VPWPLRSITLPGIPLQILAYRAIGGPGQPLEIEISFAKKPAVVRLYYRHVTHAERYETAEMAATGNRCRAVVPSTYTDSPYPLQYYFEIEQGPDSATLYPGFGADLTNQPYFVVRRV
jgi:hypothetical protein